MSENYRPFCLQFMCCDGYSWTHRLQAFLCAAAQVSLSILFFHRELGFSCSLIRSIHFCRRIPNNTVLFSAAVCVVQAFASAPLCRAFCVAALLSICSDLFAAACTALVKASSKAHAAGRKPMERVRVFLWKATCQWRSNYCQIK